MKFRYCPDCGAQLELRTLGDDPDIPWCANCEKPWFPMFSTCVISLVYNNKGEVLLLHQNYISSRYLNLVSGYMSPGENAEEAAIREIKEETGLDVEKIDLCGTWWFDKKGLLMIGFFARVCEASLSLSGEVDGAGWYPYIDAPALVHPKGSVSHALCELFIKKSSDPSYDE